jgi:hypothetical protein
MGEVAKIDRAAAKPVAPLRAGGNVLAIIPQDIDQVWRLAGMAVMGKMAPKSLVDGKEFDEAQSACAVAIMAGAELGLTPLMALRSYAVVNGRPSLWGDGLKAVVRQSGLCEYIRTGSDPTMGWCEAKRTDTGEEKRVEFTMEQAKRAGLATKAGPWRDGYADVMMERRATNRCLNDLFADVLGGIVDQQEALDDGMLDEPRDVSPRLVPPSPPSPPSPDAPIIDEEPEAVTGESDFDAAAFFEGLDAAMTGAKDPDGIEDAWTEFDVEATLQARPEDREIADKMRERHAARFVEAAAPTPPSPDAEAELFPGDK